MTDQRPPCVRVYTLGDFRVTVDGRPIAEQAWVRKAARQLLKILLSTHARRLSRAELTELLWPESPPDAASSNLRATTHALRRVLDASVVQSDRDNLWLPLDERLWLDADEFQARISSARDAADPLPLLEEADRLYAGMYLPDDQYEDWSIQRRDVLKRDWIELQLALAHERERRGSFDAAVLALNRLLDADRCDERAARELMTLLARTGRRAEARRTFQNLKEALKNELEAEPSDETVRVYDDAGMAHTYVEHPARSARAGRHLPVQAGALLGRENELAQIEDLLRSTVRLVTLVGTAGSGKTRLAVQVAGDVASHFEGGAWFVDLAPVREPDLVVFAIGRALDIPQPMDGTPQLQRVAAAIGDTPTLLVLDNFEQVVEARAHILSLIGECPNLKVLVTSRERLHLYIEHVFAVPVLVHSPAVALFIERAQAVRSGWTPGDDDMRAIAELCVRLDCLPLAIELAAARITLFAPRAMLARMNRPLDLLTSTTRGIPDHHAGLRAAFAWSYQLLSEEERSVFRRAGVFAGGWTLNAAVALCADDLAASTPILAALEALGDKNLVRVELQPDGEPRFSMLETLREFALDALGQAGELNVQQQRHAAWCLQLAEAADPELHGADQVAWLELLEREHDNLRAALDWSLQAGDGLTGARLAAALERFWEVRGYLQEGRRWLEMALQLAELPAAVRARLCNQAGHLAFLGGEQERARTLHAESLALSRSSGDRRGEVESLINLGLDAMAMGDDDQATAALTQACDLATVSVDTGSRALSLNFLGRLAYGRGELHQATQYLEASLDLRHAAHDGWGIAQVLSDMADVLRAQGLTDAARDAHLDSLQTWQELADPWGLAYGLEGVGLYLSATQPETAVRLLASAAAARDHIGIRALPVREREVQDALRHCWASLPAEQFDAAMNAGAATDASEAVLNALRSLNAAR